MKLVLILLHSVVCISLILIVLLQKGKGADMGAAFGGSSQAVFGSTGAMSFLTKTTTIVAIVFMLTSLGLTIMSGRGRSSSIMEGVNPTKAPAAQTSAPAAPPAQQKKK
jgi:preprotein translocase subunit SecG